MFGREEKQHPQLDQLPLFPYVSPKAAQKVFELTSEPCDVCGEQRGSYYTLPIYCTGNSPNNACPDCIQTGRAAQSCAGTLNSVTIEIDWGDGEIQVISPEAGKASEEVLDLVRHRTPSHHTFQDHDWPFHCADATRYIEAVSDEDILERASEFRPHWDENSHGLPWEELAKMHRGTVLDVYRCLHCRQLLLQPDMS